MRHKPSNPRAVRPSRALRMSKQDFASWGLNQAAYVQPASGNTSAAGDKKYTVHAADGRRIATLESREHAIAAIIGQGMEPLSVH